MDQAQRTEIWQRVYGHEISRRRKIMLEKPKAYKKVFRDNPKRLRARCDGDCMWVPATLLWIHDGAKGSFYIDKIKRRGLTEAGPYTCDGYNIIPQMCWNCVATRDKVTPVMPWIERQTHLAKRIAKESKGKPRGRQGKGIALDDLDDLF